jgi:alpha-D-ribose 1-methylphosphonate 5-triphosphate diphosphatase
MSRAAASLGIVGGRVLTADGDLAETVVRLADGRIARLGGPAAGGPCLDARGWLVLPGIVDLHGDAFERQVQPRPGVNFPVQLALEDSERQLLASGITTAYHGITLSWEPGLRGLAAWRAMVDALHARAWTCDMRVHLRWEACNLAALEVALADIGAGRVHLLAFNDHTQAIRRSLSDPVAAARYGERAGVPVATLRAIAEGAAAREGEVADGLDRLAAAARAAGLPMASHDDATVAIRAAFRARGARICEFPMGEAVGEAALAAGDAVVMGSPNVVRGGSHLGWASAEAMVAAGVCSVLTSDYHYPSLLHAPFLLAQRGVLGLARAWGLVSASPARVAGLADRGVIAEGRRGDLAVVALEHGWPRLVAAIVRGRPAHLTAEAWDRLG